MNMESKILSPQKMVASLLLLLLAATNASGLGLPTEVRQMVGETTVESGKLLENASEKLSANPVSVMELSGMDDKTNGVLYSHPGATENLNARGHGILESEMHAEGGGVGLLGGRTERGMEAEGSGREQGLWAYLVKVVMENTVVAASCVREGNPERRDFTLAEDRLSFTANPQTRNWPKFGFTRHMAVATVLGFVGAALANAGGVGGGGLFVPMFNLLLGFDAKTSAALSKAMVLGGSLASYSFNLQLRNPTGKGTLIDYHIALLLMPFLVLGISVGVMFNVIFPGWLIIVLLTFFLAYTTYGVTKNGIKTYKKETEFHQRLASETHRIQRNVNGNGDTESTPSEAGGPAYASVPHSDTEEGSEASSIPVPKLESILARPHSVGGDLSTHLLKGHYRNGQARGGTGSLTAGSRYSRSADGGYPSFVSSHEIGVHLLDVDDIGGGVFATPPQSPRYSHSPASPGIDPPPRHRRRRSFVEKMHMGEPVDVPIWKMVKWGALAQLAIIWLVYFLLQIGKTHSKLCGVRYWIINLLQIPLAILATISGGYQMLQKQMAEAESPENVPSGLSAGSNSTVKWTVREIATYPLAALLAGTLGGLLGIGGGMVMGPVLLGLKIHPQVTSATTSFMVIFSSAMSVTEFYLLGRIPIDFAVYYSTLCMIAALMGVSVVRALVMRSGHASIIIFVLAFVIGISGVIIAVLGTAKIVAAYYAGAYMGFHSLCAEE